MPQVVIQGNSLVIELSIKEKLASLRTGMTIPLADVESAHISENFPSGLGLRFPGTGIPGVIYAGTFYRGRTKQFVYWRKNETPVFIKIRNNSWDSVIVGSDDADELIDRINSALQ